MPYELAAVSVLVKCREVEFSLVVDISKISFDWIRKNLELAVLTTHAPWRFSSVSLYDRASFSWKDVKASQCYEIFISLKLRKSQSNERLCKSLEVNRLNL